MATYHWVISGLDSESYSWRTSGILDADDFNTALNQARQDSFLQLTKGHAKYGHPGLGCKGPYKITRLAIIMDQMESTNEG